MLQYFSDFVEKAVADCGAWVEDGKTIKDIARELERALYCKSITKNSLELSLSEILDDVWHEMILNTEDYSSYCMIKFGKILPHTTATRKDPAKEKNKRITETLKVYKKLYGDVPAASKWCWELYEEPIPKAAKRNTKRQREEKVYSDIQLFVKTLDGTTITCSLSPNETISKLKKHIYYNPMCGLSPDDQRLVFAGAVLNDNKTISDYNIGNQCTIHLVQKIRGC